jgi:hypothetical protein
MAEKKVIELEVKTNAQSLKAQLREAQQEVQALSDKFGATSAQAINAAKRAAELKDAIGDAKALTDAFNPDAKFNALSSSIGGVVNGFQAYEGALGLVGVESAQLQEQLLKVQSAMALSQGLQGLGEARDSFKQLGAVAKNVFTGIKGAIGATGIGLLVIGVGALVSNWKELTGWVEKSFPSFKKIGDFFKNFSQVASGTLDAVIAGFKTVAKVIGDVFRGDFSGAYEDAKKVGSNIANAYNKGFEEKDKEIKQNAFLKTRKFELDLLEAKGKDVADRKLRLMGAELQMLEKGSDEYNAKLIEIEEARTKIREEAAEKRRIKKEKGEEAERKAEEKALKKREDDLKWLEGFEEEIADNAKKRREKTAVDQKNAADKELEIQSNKIIEQAALDKKNAEDKKALDAQAIVDKQRTSDAIFQITRQSFDVIGNLAVAYAGQSEKEQKKAFEIQKAANIAGAVMDTYKAATGAYASLASIPVVGPVLGGVAAGVATAAGLANVKNISNQQFGSRGNISAPNNVGGGNQNQVITPNFNIIGSQNQTQLAQLNQAPIKAYVVGSDVTTQQMLDKKKIQNATL